MALTFVFNAFRFFHQLSWPLFLLSIPGSIFFLVIISKIMKIIYLYTLSNMFEWIYAQQVAEGSQEDNINAIIERKRIPFDGILCLSPTTSNVKSTSEEKAAAASQNLLQWPSYFVMTGIEAILDDEVTPAFNPQALNSWNLLIRNSYHYQIGFKLMALWFIGFFIRYCILFPYRLCIAAITICLLIVITMITMAIPIQRIRQKFYRFMLPLLFHCFNKAFSSTITFHDKQYRPRPGGICVANHTSPLDVIVLGQDQCYAMTGQRAGGFMGFIEDMFSRCESNIWFERNEMRDRNMVASHIRQHVEDPSKLPVLVFPEGVCINNKSILMFKKGSFEIGCPVYPVAIKYDCRYADCFWSSNQDHLLHHALVIMTSWALKVDVWYLPPQQRLPNEDAVAFASRVKQMIAQKANLVDLNWDGALKGAPPKDTMRATQQENFYKMLKKED